MARASHVLRVRQMGLFWAGLCVRYDAEANCWLVGPLLVRRADGGRKNYASLVLQILYPSPERAK